METNAVLFEAPQSVDVRPLQLKEQSGADVLVESLWSGISSGTEKRLFEGTMPVFPGLTYPLVPGYETVGRVLKGDAAGKHRTGDIVLVPGANCYQDAAGLFGATASHLIAPASRVIAVNESLEADATLLSLAATAHHALMRPGTEAPDLVIGHGLLGRLVIRVMEALDMPQAAVWEKNAVRRSGKFPYNVSCAENQKDMRFHTILDASGTQDVIDLCVSHLEPGGTITLAGFYDERLSFAFAPAFMREARIQIATEFKPEDLSAVSKLIAQERLSLKGLITHTARFSDAPSAYQTAFWDPACVKMILDWRTPQ
ncbi:3-hydroxyethyl bacteriochlorophyllide a dehydrogenase [Roseibium hamelinense]|uniref:3-hydroxyethyl bacteriochlorophyllide a dehydrogenase n=1 Tax=Roseibium hamelinense TaxID=150831 RepID=A0A562SXC7_9HYPH|nr:chlorophyll synthesis pathway protein BchC [Roseibium hamelinense]MTI44841.1 chlorophyll synthesis pathway protein BchC [Roseibium hamelinense]TWI85965.1 3-hydroxyethyl bacteriochlorophyllide a dehydrogenase [Roseibium hamelinense]